MEWRNLIKANLFGLSTNGRDDWKLNRVTLAFTGVIQKYEKDFRNDYFDRSLNPFRFSLVLAIFFFGIFALSSLGFPGTNSFIGEILVLTGIADKAGLRLDAPTC